MELNAFNENGTMLAVAGRRGYVHLVDWTAGAEQVVGSVKLPKGSVRSLWWARSRNGDEKTLLTLGDDAQIFEWDIGERRCVRRWTDEGGFGSSLLSGDPKGKYLAVGSSTGFVNIYDHSTVTKDAGSSPKPVKSIGNLVTAISAMRINPSAEIMAIASGIKKDQMRMVRIPLSFLHISSAEFVV